MAVEGANDKQCSLLNQYIELSQVTTPSCNCMNSTFSAKLNGEWLSLAVATLNTSCPLAGTLFTSYNLMRNGFAWHLAPSTLPVP